MIPVIKTVSPQAAEMYKLLSSGQILSAQEIAKRLDILPNAVYRVAKKLIDLGMVEQVDRYPVKFKALSAQTAMSFYMMAATHSFRREFDVAKPSAVTSKGPTISIIKDRPSMISRSDNDARMTRESIDIIVSGHPIPDESVLEYRKAAARGVALRRITHQKEQAYGPETQRWKDIGVDIRYLPDFEMRMIIFDKRIVYITSYDAKRPGSAFGVRFAYEPLALQMTDLFEQNWLKALPL